MTKLEAMRQTHLKNVLLELGFTQEEAYKLRRISMTLRRWYELECGTDAGYIERDPETDKPYMIADYGTRRSRWPVPDREKGAHKRLAAIMANHAPLQAYIQTDPRGAALYILRPGDVPEGKQADSYYTNGICV